METERSVFSKILMVQGPVKSKMGIFYSCVGSALGTIRQPQSTARMPVYCDDGMVTGVSQTRGASRK